MDKNKSIKRRGKHMLTRIEKAFRDKELSGVEVARLLKVSESEISKWRKGRAYVPQKYRMPLSNLLGLDISELVDDRGIPKLAEQKN